VAVGTTDVVTPVFAAPKVVMFLFPGMASQTCLGYFLRRLVLERDDLLWIAFSQVFFARSMTRLAPGNLVFPASQTTEAGVGGRDKVLKLILMAIFAGFTSNVLIVDVLASRRDWRVCGCDRCRKGPGKNPGRTGKCGKEN